MAEAALVIESREDVIQAAAPVISVVGNTPVGPFGIILITAYLLALSGFLLYSLMQFWPSQMGEAPMQVSFLFRQLQIPVEVGLFVVVGVAGGLGSLVHALRSFYWYAGNRALVWSWVLQYMMLPFVGGILGVVFYVVVRGGFFSPQATFKDISPFGFAALAGLVGLFSDQAVEKLKQVATTMLAEAPKGTDQAPTSGQAGSSGSNRSDQTR